MYAICTSLIYLCFVFFPFVLCVLFETTFYVFHVNLLMHMNMTDDHARAVLWYSYLSSCSDIHMNIFIFDENVICIVYFYISYTVTLHLSYLRHIHFQQQHITWISITYNLHCVSSTTGVLEHFTIICYTVFYLNFTCSSFLST